MRPIDADELVNQLKEKAKGYDFFQEIIEQIIQDMIDLIDDQNTVVVLTKPHWVKQGDYAYSCSVCGGYEEYASPYCPHCGAKMDGEKNVQ